MDRGSETQRQETGNRNFIAHRSNCLIHLNKLNISGLRLAYVHTICRQNSTGKGNNLMSESDVKKVDSPTESVILILAVNLVFK